MTVSATDTPTTVVISENGASGANGNNGADGSGFNDAELSSLDNYLFRGFANNNLVDVSAPTGTDADLIFTRAGSGNADDFYNQVTEYSTDEPRLSNKGWLVEETKTNELIYSEDFLNAAWFQGIYNGGANDFWTLTASTTDITDIYGTNTSSKFVSTATPSKLFAKQIGAVLNTGVSTSTSIYVYVPTQSGLASFDIGVFFQGSADRTTTASTVFDRWVRVDVPIDTTVSPSELNIDINPDGVSPVSGFTFYSMAAQAELGSLSSYIKSVAAPTTRASDLINIPSENNIPAISSEHSIFMRLDIKNNTQLGRLFSLRVLGASALDNYTCFFNSTQIVYRVSASPLQEITYTVDATTIDTICFVVDSSSTARLYINGSEVGSISNVEPHDINIGGQMYLFSRDNITGFQDVSCSDLRVYDFALSDNQNILLSGS